MQNENNKPNSDEIEVSKTDDSDYRSAINEIESDAPDAAVSEEDVAPLESMLYDSDDEVESRETPEEAAQFESFLSDYKAHILKTLSEFKFVSRSTTEKDSAPAKNKATNERTSNKQERPHLPQKKKNDDSDESWSDEITLAPEVYEDPDEEDNIFREVPLPEEESEEESFSIGEEAYEKEDDNQFSFSFDENAEKESTSQKDEENFAYNPDKPRLVDSVFDFVELFVVTLVCVMILTTFVFKHSIVDGASMENTLHDKESLIITDLFYTPKRGDIIVFEDYSTRFDYAVVKRVIGLPGDTVEVRLNEDKVYEVYINGSSVPLDEDYAYNDTQATQRPTGIWEVGDDEVFVMGDNRYHSADSREIGPIKIDCILGKVIFRFYPFDKFGKVE